MIFVGSGLSCSYTLLRLFEELKARSAKPASVAVIEKAETFWTGLPCGERSSSTSLMITNLDDFLPDQDKSDFFAWLKTYDWHQVSAKGSLAALWFERNRGLIERKDWGSLYLPRHVFGMYITKKVGDAFASAYSERRASVATAAGEAIDVLKQDNSYHVTVQTKSARFLLSAPAVVLAVGSPPYSSLKTFSDDNKLDATVVDDPYAPSLSHNLARIRRALIRVESGSRNVLIVGSNATALEILYHLARDRDVDATLESAIVLSRGGSLPRRVVVQTRGKPALKNLSGLKRAAYFDAADLFEAVRKDLQTTEGQGSTCALLLDRLTSIVPKLMSKLSEEQQLEFQNKWGLEFTKLIRRAGGEYADAANDLLVRGKLSVCAGELVRLKRSGSSVYAQYVCPKQGPVTHPTRFSAVVNCRGFEKPDRSSESKIISNLIAQGICKVNSSGRGFQVNEDLEASDKFYVLGPLLAGIYNSKLRGWHLETARRIYPAAVMLAETLAQRF